MGNAIQSIFRDEFAGYCKRHQVPRHQRRAAQAIVRCRTAAMGAHAAVCDEGHLEGVYYNSCRHRSCTQCNSQARIQWLERTLDQLLPCAHYHVIFTVPHDLNPLWRYNRRLFGSLLFRCSAQALQVLTRSPRYLGAEVGMLGCLHTWGRSLSEHPHTHFLVTDGGIDTRGQWKSSRNGYLVPMKPLMMLFRGKLLDHLRQAFAAEQLVLPPSLNATQFDRLLKRLGRVKWNVRIRERYPYGEGVVKYLARYVRGGALRSGQVTRRGERIEFRYHDHRHGASRLSLAPETFLQRVLTHVPWPRMHVVRRYGLYAPSCAGARRAARERMPAETTAQRAARSAQPRPDWAPLRRCPHCGGIVRYVRMSLPARGPPSRTAGSDSASRLSA